MLDDLLLKCDLGK